MRVGSRTFVKKRSEKGDSGAPLQLAPVLDTDKAVGALANFLGEAKAILDAVEASYLRGEGRAPMKRARREILRFLDQIDEEVELRDLPVLSTIGLGRGKELVHQMAEEGLLILERSEVYPNMVYLKISPEGQEELRKIRVKEAMEWLHGVNCDVSEAIGTARTALHRLVDVIAL